MRSISRCSFAVVSIFTPLILLGEGLCALVSAYLMSNVLRACSYDPDAEADDALVGQDGGDV